MPINTSGPIGNVTQAAFSKIVAKQSKLSAGEASFSARQSMVNAQHQKESSQIKNATTKEGRAMKKAADEKHAKATIAIQKERLEWVSRFRPSDFMGY